MLKPGRKKRGGADDQTGTRLIPTLPPAGISRVEHAYRRILAHITEGLLIEGDRLPSEADMVAAFGVSRPVIREALTRLQQAGVISSRWGAGSYILDPESIETSTATTFGPVESLDEVKFAYEVRIALEGEAAFLCASRRSEESIVLMRRAFAKMEEAIETKAVAAEADLEFHMAIAVASGNPFFARMLQSIHKQIAFSMSLARSLALTHKKERLRAVQAEHAVILEAIEQKMPDLARNAMDHHLKSTAKRIFQGPSS